MPTQHSRLLPIDAMRGMAALAVPFFHHCAPARRSHLTRFVQVGQRRATP